MDNEKLISENEPVGATISPSFFPLNVQAGMLLGVPLPGALLSAFFGYLYLAQAESPEPVSIWLFAAILAITAVEAAYGIWTLVKKKSAANPAWVIISVLHCAWLTLAITNLVERFSFSTTVPWLLISALSMLPVLFSMSHIILWLTPREKPHSIGITLLPLLAVPVLWYLIVNTLRYAADGASGAIMLLLAVVSAYCFVLILLRVLYLLACKSGSFWKVARIVILFVLPLLGLAVTQTAPDFSFFWDFSSIIYYLLVIVNGILMLLREPSKSCRRFALFYGRCVTYLALTYFFVCLSPFYALSLLGILIFGLGLLVLSPLFLWIYQTRVLVASGSLLARDHGRLKTVGTALLGLLTIPVCLIISFYADKANLDVAMTYLDSAAEVADAGAVNVGTLKQSLKYLRHDGQKLRFNYYDREQERPSPPILSQIYNRVVHEGKKWGDHNIDGINSLFFDSSSILTGRPYSYGREFSSAISLTHVEVDTRMEGDYYKSFVHLTLENLSDWDDEEYVTSFDLPDGVFISDYYLDVFGERKHGLLSTKSSALWIYDKVVSSALDPGILYYDGEDVVLRVFPFAEEETRYTGIEFIHKEPVSLEIDGTTIQLVSEAQDAIRLAAGSRDTNPIESDNGVIYLSAAAKSAMPSIRREPRYAFVVDCSEDSDVGLLVNRLHDFCDKNDIEPEYAAVTALNYRRATWPMAQPDWEKSLMKFGTAGGFGLGLAADTICREYTDENTYPVIIVLTDDTDRAMLPRDTSYLAERSPELDGYYVLDAEGLYLYPFDENQSVVELSELPEAPELILTEAGGGPIYLRNDGNPQLILREGEEYGGLSADLEGSSWENALKLTGDYLRAMNNSEDEKQNALIEIVKNSFHTGIMTPLTSYIVLETKEQEDEMLEHQKKLLESGMLEESDEEPVDDEDDWPDVPMTTSEPSMLVCLMLLIPIAVFLRKRKYYQNL